MSTYPVLDALELEFDRAVRKGVRSPKRRRRRSLLGVVVPAVALGAVAAAIGGNLIATDESAESKVDPRLRDAFGVLQRDRQAGDDVPGVREQDDHYGFEYAAARRVRSDLPEPTWLIPGSAGICISQQADFRGESSIRATACGYTDDALTGRISLERERPDGSIVAAGLMPDGVTSVVLIFEDGDVQRVPVEDNVYYSEVAATPVAVTWMQGGASRRRPLR